MTPAALALVALDTAPIWIVYPGDVLNLLGLLGSCALALATLGKVGGSLAAARMTGLERGEANLLAALLNTRGLVELIVLSVGRSAGLIDAQLFSVLVIMALATTLATGRVVSRLMRVRERELVLVA